MRHCPRQPAILTAPRPTARWWDPQAHNIDSVLIEAMSINIHKRHVDRATANIAKLRSKIKTLKEQDSARLADESEARTTSRTRLHSAHARRCR